MNEYDSCCGRSSRVDLPLYALLHDRTEDNFARVVDVRELDIGTFGSAHAGGLWIHIEGRVRIRARCEAQTCQRKQMVQVGTVRPGWEV